MREMISEGIEKFKILIPVKLVVGIVLMLIGFVIGTQTVGILGAYDTLGERWLDAFTR
jgi:hypothetical protein